MNRPLSLAKNLAIVCVLVGAAPAAAHQGPDPVAHWTFSPRTVADGVCRPLLGPEVRLPAGAKPISDAQGNLLDLLGSGGVGSEGSGPVAADDLPSDRLTVAAWVLLDEAEELGGIAGVVASADGAPAPGGWRLGYDKSRFTFRVATGDAAAPQEALVTGRTPYAKGTWFHVVGVYTGDRIELYVNGQPDGESEAPSGPIAYAPGSRYVLAATGEAGPASLCGQLRDVAVYNLAARPQWVAHAFDHLKQMVSLPQDARGDALTMIVDPYLQFGTTDGMTVMWQTTRPGTTVVRYGESAACDKSVTGADATIHEARIEGLEPATQYFYRVETVAEGGERIESGVSTFSTAVPEGTPFAYAVISDTQFNPVVSGKLCEYAWAQRASFALHPGDLVDTGTNDSHWTQHFFPGMRPLISRVPFYSVLGNHEQNASNYFEYVSVPSPEYYYEFRYGDAHFFMIDSNRDVSPGSEQYEWLDKALAASKATWKFAAHHHPPYSSDEDDYGNLWMQNKSTQGDPRARELSALYEKHGVDVVWTGHIHSYERTWPVREGKAVTDGAPIYMVVGGGGGNLETPGPHRPFFQNNVRRGHHYVMAHVNGPTLEIRSFDLDERLFDTVRIEKKPR